MNFMKEKIVKEILICENCTTLSLKKLENITRTNQGEIRNLQNEKSMQNVEILKMKSVHYFCYTNEKSI